MDSNDPEDQEKSLAAFKKCGNIDMCFAIANKQGLDIPQLRLELIESLLVANRHSDAANLLCQVDGYGHLNINPPGVP